VAASVVPVPLGAGRSWHPAVLGISLTAEPVNGSAPLQVEFDANLTPGSSSASFSWSFGDGATVETTGGNHSSVEHTYARPGLYTADVLVVSNVGDGNASLLVAVVSSPLGATITTSVAGGPAPLTVQFVATPSGGSGTYVSITWQFGDGGSGSGADLRYTYAMAGEYNATVNVTDSNGASATAAVTIHVGPGPGGPVGAPAPPPNDAGIEWVAVGLSAAAIGLASYRYVLGRRALPPSVPAGASGAVRSRAPTPQRSPVDPAALPSPPTEESRRLSERILVHLYWSGRPTPDGVAKAAASQAGMVRELGVTQNAISKAAQRLVDSGAVTVELRHVPGAPRRLKTYRLTPRGVEIARGLAFDAPPRAGP
jgi:PKD repeat protein